MKVPTLPKLTDKQIADEMVKFRIFADENHVNLTPSIYPGNYATFKYPRTQHMWESFLYRAELELFREPTLWEVRVPDLDDESESNPDDAPAEYTYCGNIHQVNALLKCKGASVYATYVNASLPSPKLDPLQPRPRGMSGHLSNVIIESFSRSATRRGKEGFGISPNRVANELRRNGYEIREITDPNYVIAYEKSAISLKTALSLLDHCQEFTKPSASSLWETIEDFKEAQDKLTLLAPPVKYTWEEVISFVGQAIGSWFEPNPDLFIGHQMTGINFNSLARIIDAVQKGRGARV